MFWRVVGEAFRVAGVGLVEHGLTFFDDFHCHAVMQHLRGQHGDAAVTVFLVVPGKELSAEGAGIFDGAEAFRKLGAVFHGFELAFRVGIVV